MPYGSYSYIENLDWELKKKKEETKEFNLYGSGGFKFFWDTKWAVFVQSHSLRKITSLSNPGTSRVFSSLDGSQPINKQHCMCID